uniref:Uncharacterized protein n=1 Tax=Romanomermis culicivorax TaxID=13658 RepID=A0A915JBU5_ROMCU
MYNIGDNMDDGEAGTVIQKRFGVEDRQLRVGERQYQNVPQGGHGDSRSTGEGMNSYGWVIVTGNAREIEGEY